MCCLDWLRTIELKSLDDVWYTLLAVCVQIVCIWRAIERIRKYTHETWEPFARPVAELGTYVVCTVASVCLLPLMIWSGLVRVGAYANDRFKFGHDLDTRYIAQREFTRRPPQPPPPPPRRSNSAGGSSSSHSPTRTTRKQRRDQRPKSMSFLANSKLATANSTAIGGPTNCPQAPLKRYNSSSAAIDSFAVLESNPTDDQHQQMPNNNNNNLNLNKFDYFSDTGVSSSSPKQRQQQQPHQGRRVHMEKKRGSRGERLCGMKLKWRHLMPLSSLAHLLIAACLLFPNVLLVAKQIQYGLRPKGNIHHTELDFLFARPIQRFADTTNADSSNRRVDSAATDLSTSSSPLATIKFKLISALLDDNDEINYEPQVSLELVNFVVAGLVFALHYATPLWHLNKLFATLFSAHVALLTLVTAVSFAAFEVLVKFETVFSHGIRFANINGTLVPTAATAAVSTVTSPLSSSSLLSTSSSITSAALFDLPFLTTPFTLSLVFLVSFVLMLASTLPIYSFALQKYKQKYVRLRNNFLTVIANSRGKSSKQSQQQQPFYIHGGTLITTAVNEDLIGSK